MAGEQLGSTAYAWEILEYVRMEEQDDMMTRWCGYHGKDLPEGWKYLGSGCWRAVFLGPDGVVYKVDHGDGNGSYAMSNLCEFVSARYGAERAGFGEWMPQCNLHAFVDQSEYVIAMEYIEDRADDLDDEDWNWVSQMNHGISAYDDSACRENVRKRPDGSYVVTDLGCDGRIERLPKPVQEYYADVIAPALAAAED